jgi:hypothetical protein
MKKVLLLFVCIMFAISIYGQTTTFRTDVILDKAGTVADRLYLTGTGSLVSFGGSNMSIIQSTGLLTISGGNLSLGSNSLLLTGSIGSTGGRITKGWFTNLELTNLPTIGGASLSTLFVPVTRTVNNKALSSNITITASDVSLGNVTNESKTSMFISPSFTGTVSLNSIPLTATATDLNKLTSTIATANNINQLFGITSNIQDQLNSKVSTYNTTFTGLTQIHELQIGTADSAVVLSGLADSGQGLTVLNIAGAQIGYNFPSNAIIPIQQIPYISIINTAAGDTSNFPIPTKVLDMYFDSSNNKLYIAKTAARGGWIKLN